MSRNFYGINATISPVVSIGAAIYSIAMAVFRHSVYEDKGFMDTAKDVLQYVILAVLSVRAKQITGGHSTVKTLYHLAITISTFRLVRATYAKYVVGKEYTKIRVDNKVYIITGCNTGIGYETAKALLEMGGTVIMACRSVDKAEEARSRLLEATGVTEDKAVVLRLDLCDFVSVRTFVVEFEKLKLPLHGLINNAGIMMDKRCETKDGLEMVMTANHLSHFLLTNLLIGHLEKSAGRIVVLSSSLHHSPSSINLDDFMSEKAYSLFGTYSQAKLANVMHVKMLAALLQARKSRVTVNAVHPGCVRTEVTRHMSPVMQFLNYLGTPFMLAMQKTPAQGAYCTVFVATSGTLRGQSGNYYFHCKKERVNAAANNHDECLKLWQRSEEITQSSAPVGPDGMPIGAPAGKVETKKDK